MKKNILFVIDSLHCAGAEKSLVTLLSLIDYKKYNVDLQLLGYGGALESLIPKDVNLLKPLSYTEFTSIPLKKSIKYAMKTNQLSMLIARIKYSKAIRKKTYSNAEKARLYWENNSSVIDTNNKKYDIAISYAQGVPTFYVAEKVNAIKKFAWVNVGYKLYGKDKLFQEQMYNKYNNIIAVSESSKSTFIECYPQFNKKMKVIYDINDYNLINEMSKLDSSYDDEFNGLRILTIGRLAKQKGYDIAIEACKKLKEKGINFKWYVLGIGPLKEEIENSIKYNNLEDRFILLGVKSNPYPYIKDCDIYVQTSKHEGFGLAIAEARMLNKPVVTTRFDAVYSQMINEKNGLVMDMNSQSIAEGIERLIADNKLRKSIIDYLKDEKKGNTEELEKFYELIEAN